MIRCSLDIPGRRRVSGGNLRRRGGCLKVDIAISVNTIDGGARGADCGVKRL
jgi:hypothetical protein